MLKTISQLIIGLALTTLSLYSLAQTPNSLEKVDFQSLPGNRLQITLQLASAAIEPLSFTINNPGRIVFDLADTQSNLAQRNIAVGVGIANAITVASTKNRTRLVINVSQLVSYDTKVDGNKILITLDNSSAPEKASNNKSNVNTAFNDTGTGLPINRGATRNINNIDFRRGPNGEGRIIVKLSSAKTPIDIEEQSGKLIIDFLQTELPEDFQRRLDVLDFATPVKTIDSFKHGKNTRVVVTPVDFNYDHLAYQSDDTFTLELKPISREDKEKQAKDKFGYTGDRLSLNFQDIEVRSVLQLIADFTNLNVVVSDSVKGNLTLRLKNVPWDQALDIILDAKGLDMRKSGSVLLIAPTEELAKQEQAQLQARQQAQELAQLRSEYIQINYAKAKDLEALIMGSSGASGASGASGGGKQGALISDRGKISTDERTNTLLIQETAQNLEEIRSLITRLDVPVRQVLIESRIVIATDDFEQQMGVRFGGLRSTDASNNAADTDPNRLSPPVVPSNGSIITGGLGAVTDYINGTAVDLDDRMNVNLPTTQAAGKIAFALAKMPWGTLLELELSALQAENRGEVISNPRVITANQQKAFIEQGTEIPYVSASSSGATTISFKKAVLSLTVTPQITPDDRIIMDLSVTNDSVGQIFSGIPSIDTREINTKVLVNNGETVVLGGVYEEINRNEVDRVPFLGNLPGIGFLFRRTDVANEKSELLIFVTPKILKDGQSIQ
ncbi:MAG: type IV pilus secretin PilQ [Gammaproteobacteria bacterium]|nr:type IV pilus secretin PilQ [Gammaproteobacteria bacterium]